MDSSQSEIIAIRAIEWLASQENEFQNFKTLTGITVEDIRSRLNDPEFLASVMDFILASEKRLLEFCEDIQIAPELLIQLRQFLPGGDVPHWT